jgi:GcrA cell cycle regulator
MDSISWSSAHTQALREYLLRGMSFSEIADAINLKFRTGYTRSATIGRAKRMGLTSANQPKDLPSGWPRRRSRAKSTSLQEPRERHAPEFFLRIPVFERVEMPPLRSLETHPRHVSLTDLGAGDCRYPYGGEEEGDPITFCGRPQREESSYCTPHFHLTRGPPRRGCDQVVCPQLVDLA